MAGPLARELAAIRLAVASARNLDRLVRMAVLLFVSVNIDWPRERPSGPKRISDTVNG
jgi:hypothetical protein